MIKYVISLLLLGLAMPAIADDNGQSLDNLQQFASLIRWSGVIFSGIIVAAAWLLLRFTQSIVDGVSSQFAQRRMLMQKLQSFFQFFIYMSTGITIFMLSFRVDERVLALIGGTIAVSVGFALKDLTASLLPA